MVKVSIRVRKGAVRFDVAVHAESVEQALGLLRGRYSGDVRVRSIGGPDGPASTAALASPVAMAA